MYQPDGNMQKLKTSDEERASRQFTGHHSCRLSKDQLWGNVNRYSLLSNVA